jgi:hypothetical protein
LVYGRPRGWYEHAPYSRADSLHAIARGEEDWKALFKLRNPTESVNSWLKAKWQGRKARAPAVGAARQQFALIGAALYSNFQGALAHAERLERAA